MKISSEEYEFELTRNFNLGIGSGMQRAAELIIEKATKAFQRNDDTMATNLRDLHDVLKKIGKEKADEARNRKFEAEDVE